MKYALKALMELAAERAGEGRPLRIEEIATRSGTPKRFLEHILLEIRNAGFIASVRGRHGGYILIKEPRGAPFIERLRDNAVLTAALTAITAVVVGVILNLAVWCGLHVVFDEVRTLTTFGLDLDLPVSSTLNPAAAMLVLAAVVAVFRIRVGPVTVLSASAILGLMLATANVL